MNSNVFSLRKPLVEMKTIWCCSAVVSCSKDLISRRWDGCQCEATEWLKNMGAWKQEHIRLGNWLQGHMEGGMPLEKRGQLKVNSGGVTIHSISKGLMKPWANFCPLVEEGPLRTPTPFGLAEKMGLGLNKKRGSSTPPRECTEQTHENKHQEQPTKHRTITFSTKNPLLLAQGPTDRGFKKIIYIYIFITWIMRTFAKGPCHKKNCWLKFLV